jgi:hypothetical protein
MATSTALHQRRVDPLQALLLDANATLRGLARHRLAEFGWGTEGESLTPPAGRISSVAPAPSPAVEPADGTSRKDARVG